MFHVGERLSDCTAGGYGEGGDAVSEYTDWLRDVFEQFGPIHARGMVGGTGV